MARPIGVAIIAILLAIGGVFQITSGLEIAGITNLGWFGDLDNRTGTGGGYAFLGAVSLLVAYSLWTLRPWAWTVAVAVLIFNIIASIWVLLIYGIGSGIGYGSGGMLIVSAILLAYLSRANVRTAFRRDSPTPPETYGRPGAGA